MLRTLHDPLTAVDLETNPAGRGMPTASDVRGVRVVRVGGYPPTGSSEAYAKALSALVSVPASVSALVVDLRASAPPSLEQLVEAKDSWSQVALASHVLTTATSRPLLARRYYLGFPPESGITSGDYEAGRATTSDLAFIVPAGDAHNVRIAFMVNEHAYVPDDAVALARAGHGAMFSEDGSTGILPGDATPLDAGEGLHVSLRTSGLLEAPPIRRGGMEAALAFTRSTRSIPPARAPVPASQEAIEKRFASRALPNEAERVLAAFRMWGTIAYFYPYKSLMGEDWDAALRAALPEVRHARTGMEYELALIKMYAHLHDTHGFVGAPAVAEQNAALPPFVARDVEGKPTIVRVDPLAAARDGFVAGDVIESIDGESVAGRAARLRPYVVASTEQSTRELLDDRRLLPSLFSGPAGSTALLVVRGRDGSSREIRTRRMAFQAALHARTRPVVDVLPGNVGYADLQRLEVGDVDAMLRRFATTRAVVFDLRGYPRGTAWAIAPRLTDSVVRAALFRTPVRREPIQVRRGEREFEYLDETRDFYQLIAPERPRLAKPVVVVIDARAISQAEHTALYLRASSHARLVGEPTAGANGDVTRFFLPGGMRAHFTGQAVLHPDGSQLQRIGIIPDVHVGQTLRGVRAGADELLSAALREALRLSDADPATTAGALREEGELERVDALAQQRPSTGMR